MVYTTTAPTTPTTDVAVKVDRQPSLETQLKAALEHARRLTAMDADKIEIAIAWETVEELQKAQYQKNAAVRTPFANYCAENPDAPECRIYED